MRVMPVIAVLCALVLSAVSCSESKPASRPAHPSGKMSISVDALVPDYEMVTGKATLANNPAIEWRDSDKVYVYDAFQFLGTLYATRKDVEGRVARLSGSGLETSYCDNLTLLAANCLEEAPEMSPDGKISIDISELKDKANKFVAYTTLANPGADSVVGQVLQFSFATSMVEVYATSTNVTFDSETKAYIDGVNTKCVLNLGWNGGVDGVSGEESGTAVGSVQVGKAGLVVASFSLAATPDATASEVRFIQDSVEFTANVGFPGAIAASKFYSTGVILPPLYIPVTSMFLNRSEILVFPSSTFKLVAVISPDNASDKSVTWTSSNDLIADVREDGLVTGLESSDTPVTITVKSNDNPDVTATCLVRVGVQVKSLSLSGSDPIRIHAGESYSLQATVTPENATDDSVIFTSSDDSIATVNAAGKIEGKAEGDVVITATSKSNPSVQATRLVYVTYKGTEMQDIIF